MYNNTRDDHDVERKRMTFGEYGEHHYTIYRVKNDEDAEYAFEFELHVDGEEITTATEMEEDGWSAPWLTAMRRYAKAYIQGAEQ